MWYFGGLGFYFAFFYLIILLLSCFKQIGLL